MRKLVILVRLLIHIGSAAIDDEPSIRGIFSTSPKKLESSESEYRPPPIGCKKYASSDECADESESMRKEDEESSDYDSDTETTTLESTTSTTFSDNDSSSHGYDEFGCKTVKLKSFKRQEKIGSGGFGYVYKIQKRNSEVFYAAKVSKKSILDLLSKADIDAISLHREISIQARLDHPLIVKFIGYSLTDFKKEPKPVIVSEYVVNGSLDRVLKDEQKSLVDSKWNDTKKLINIYGIASAMLHMHEKNILHLDLKAENVLVDENFFPKLSDFGLSKDMSADDHSSEFKGTPTHIAPEIWNGSNYSKASDVYAFGLTVFEIMTNEKPFIELNNIYQIMSEVSILGHRPSFKYPIHPRYQKLIVDCWSQNPSERPSFDEIVESLRSDPEFITEMVDEDEYLNFIELVDSMTSNNADALPMKVVAREIVLSENVVERSANLNSFSLKIDEKDGKIIESEKEDKIIESEKEDKIIESGKEGKIIESGKEGKIIESGKEGKIIESGKEGKIIENEKIDKIVEDSISDSNGRENTNAEIINNVENKEIEKDSKNDKNENQIESHYACQDEEHSKNLQEKKEKSSKKKESKSCCSIS